MNKIQDTTLKLLFAGIITVLGITFGFGAIVAGLVANLDITETILLTGVFGNITTAGVVYFLGYSNGRTNVANQVGNAVIHEREEELRRQVEGIEVGEDAEGNQVWVREENRKAD